MPPVIQAVVSFVASSVFAITGSSVLAAYASLATLAVANFAIKAVAVIGLSRLLGPKGPKAQQAERQADVLNLTLGEGPREALFGTAATGGSLMDAFNHGPNNEWEVQVVAVADHECDALVGFFVNDTYVAFAGDGAVAGFNDNLFVYWKSGAPGQTALNYLTINSGGAWTSNDVATGVAYVVYAYKYDQKTFPTGRPTFRAVVRGLKCYDPRKDSTVAGGSGSHRWGTPSTYEWTDNAAICRYNYQRGVFTNGQLVVGPGRTADEAPPEAVIGPANICDENVALKAGGTEKRYRVSGVVRADESWLAVEEDFAAAMAGDLVERSGALFIDPGAAKSSVFSFTDDDLVFDQPVTVQAKVSRRELVNTVAAAYIEPTRLWQSTSAPLRRSLTDITTDGEVRERPLDLRFVTSQAQAQRLAEIERRKMRLQRTASVVLGPAACILEAGDWVTWTSARYHGGAARTYQIVGVAIDEKLQTSLQLREINSTVYSWTAATDELDLLAPAYTAPGAMPAATISGFNATAVSITGSSGSQVPALSVTWTAPTDPSIYAITFEWRKVGDTNTLKATHLRPQDGVIVLAGGITSTVDFEVRAIPETDPERDETPTAWRTVTSTALAAATAGSVTGGVLWGSITGTGKPADNATRNVVTYAATAPASPADGDIWVDTSVTPNVQRVRISGAWQAGANLVTNTNQVTDGAGLGTTATWSGVSGSGKPADNATRNIVTYSATAPSTPADGDIWVDTGVTPNVQRVRVGGAWQAGPTRNTGALADLNSVNTARVDANAITVTAAQYNAGAITIPTTYTTLATISITAEAGDIIDLAISAFFSMTTSRTFTSVAGIWKISRGGTTIYETTTVEGDRGLTDDVQFGGRGLVAANVLDTPGAGTWTYTLEAYRSGGIGGAATNRYLRALRLRR